MLNPQYSIQHCIPWASDQESDQSRIWTESCTGSPWASGIRATNGQTLPQDTPSGSVWAYGAHLPGVHNPLGTLTHWTPRPHCHGAREDMAPAPWSTVCGTLSQTWVHKLSGAFMPKGKRKWGTKFTPVFTLYAFQAMVQSNGLATNCKS